MIENYNKNNDIIELSREFDFEGYQVVRREFFAHTNEPSITFNNYKFYPNAACLRRFPYDDFVQILINREKKIMVLRVAKEEDKDAFLWCSKNGKKRSPKQITCRLFFAKIFELMDWNTEYRYKLLGKIVRSNDEFLIVFDLSATEIYIRVQKNGEKVKTSRKPIFPEEWHQQFGLPYKEHQKSLHINIFDGYAVYGIKENKIVPFEENPYRNEM